MNLLSALIVSLEPLPSLCLILTWNGPLEWIFVKSETILVLVMNVPLGVSGLGLFGVQFCPTDRVLGIALQITFVLWQFSALDILVAELLCSLT